MNGSMGWKRKLSAGFVPAAAVMAVVFLAGCGLYSSTRNETKQIYGEVGGSEGPYQKTLVVVPFENDAPWIQADLGTLFLDQLNQVIQNESGRIQLLLPGRPGYPDTFRQLQKAKDGSIDTRALALTGRASGVNLVLTGRLENVRYRTMDKGMFWFARTIHLARFQIGVTLYHTGTGAKVLDRAIFHDVEIAEAEGSLIEAGQKPGSIDMPTVLSEIDQKMGELLYSVLKYIPWEGYVGAVEGDRIILPFGESCGLGKGDDLVVFSVEPAIEGKSGQPYSVPGREIGRIEVVAAASGRSEAVVTEGGPVLPGCAVRAK